MSDFFNLPADGRTKHERIKHRHQGFIFHTVLPEEIATRLDEAVFKCKTTYSQFIRAAIIEYLEKFEKAEKEKNNEQ